MRRPPGRPLAVMVRIVDCLSYALETGQDAGIWGSTEEQRRQIRSAPTATGAQRRAL
jgi:hypothetical protein